jgi:hypothetical protein
VGNPLTYIDSKGLSTGRALAGAGSLYCRINPVACARAGAAAARALAKGAIACGVAYEAAKNWFAQDGSDKPSLVDPKGEEHILDGDETGGGHRPGTGKPGKSEFPSGWTDEKIVGEISDVATDPNSARSPSRGGRTVVEGTRDGTDIRVIVDPSGRIVTGYPTNTPRNPR